MKKKHVLIVEDYQAVALTLSLFLSELNVTSDIAVTGRDGLEAARKNRYNIILMDMGLPENGGGLRVIKEIRKLDDKIKSQVPIVGHSCSFHFLGSELKEIGMQDFFIKPISFSIFKNTFLKHVL